MNEEQVLPVHKAYKKRIVDPKSWAITKAFKNTFTKTEFENKQRRTILLF